tara:strand:- start:272 stop:943 length:672 start_codon:yes stop_codon:yes gene_type:complete
VQQRSDVVLLRGAALALVIVTLGVTADSTNNQDGSLNTNTVDSTVDSNNVSEDNSTSVTNNGAGAGGNIPVTSAIAPSYITNGLESCLRGGGAGLQTGVFGITAGRYKDDHHCNRRRDAKMLMEQGMKVAAIARMCEDNKVWRAMFISGTPCPILSNGKLVAGKRSYLIMKTLPELYIPDYSKKNKEWYNSILGIGKEDDEEQDSDTDLSISDRFRSSSKPAR